jgi:hypothetical protein
VAEDDGILGLVRHGPVDQVEVRGATGAVPYPDEDLIRSGNRPGQLLQAHLMRAPQQDTAHRAAHLYFLRLLPTKGSEMPMGYITQLLAMNPV